MKSKLILLFILLSICVFGQVPNTTTFSLQDVIDEVNLTTDDLQDCFNDANASYFNPTYSGSKNSLLNFRDYGVHNATLNTYSLASQVTECDTTINITDYSSADLACSKLWCSSGSSSSYAYKIYGTAQIGTQLYLADGTTKATLTAYRLRLEGSSSNVITGIENGIITFQELCP